jgi:hypothetical protein
MRYLLAFLLCTTLAQANELTGKVIHVADGDTITILTEDKQRHRIRIGGIDAPEKAQPFGNRSKQNMERMAKGKEALADCPKTDRYGRKVCKVWVRPETALRVERLSTLAMLRSVQGRRGGIELMRGSSLQKTVVGMKVKKTKRGCGGAACG